jgi:adenylate kinase
MNLVMLGPPGAGKGTQADRVASAFGVPKISTGDILREAAQAGTELGRQVKEVMAAGYLVDDRMMIEIVRERLGRDDTSKGFVLDGFPRTVAQAEALDEILAGRDALLVVDVEVPDDELVRRLGGRRICSVCGVNAPPSTPLDATCPTCGGRLVTRSDDKESVVRERLRVYQQKTKPLVDYYRRRPSFFTVDGNGSPDDVFGAIQSVLSPAGSRRGGAERTR